VNHLSAACLLRLRVSSQFIAKIQMPYFAI